MEENSTPGKRLTKAGRIRVGIDKSLNYLGIKGVKATKGIGEGFQSYVSEGHFDPASANLEIIVGMYTSVETYRRMIELGGNGIAEVDHYMDEVRTEAQGMTENKLREAGYEICDMFLSKSKEKNQDDKPLYMMAIQLFRQGVGEHRLKRVERLSALCYHPNVLNIFYVSNGSEKKLKIAIMEHISTASRAQMDTLNLEEITEIGIQAAKGIGAFHREKIIHRDIKPDNLLIHITPKKRKISVKLGDFGNVTPDFSELGASDWTMTLDGMVLVTTGYAAPEQIVAKTTYRSDIFSFGASLYRFITGLVPNQPSAEKLKHSKGDIGDAMQYNLMLMTSYLQDKSFSTVTLHDKPVTILALKESYKHGKKKKLKSMELVLAGALNVDPDRRYSTIDDIRHDLELVKQGKEPEMIYEVVRKLGTDMNSYIKETFAYANNGVPAEAYVSNTNKPKIGFLKKALIGGIGIGALVAGSYFLRQGCEPLNNLWNKVLGVQTQETNK